MLDIPVNKGYVFSHNHRVSSQFAIDSGLEVSERPQSLALEALTNEVSYTCQRQS
jgi:hypothetical protein